MDMSFSLLNGGTPHGFLNFTLLKGAFSYRIEYLFMYIFICIVFVCTNCTLVEESVGDCWWFWIA